MFQAFDPYPVSESDALDMIAAISRARSKVHSLFSQSGVGHISEGFNYMSTEEPISTRHHQGGIDGEQIWGSIVLTEELFGISIDQHQERLSAQLTSRILSTGISICLQLFLSEKRWIKV